jgi:hypothetical protein
MYNASMKTAQCVVPMMAEVIRSQMEPKEA